MRLLTPKTDPENIVFNDRLVGLRGAVRLPVALMACGASLNHRPFAYLDFCNLFHLFWMRVLCLFLDGAGISPLRATGIQKARWDPAAVGLDRPNCWLSNPLGRTMGLQRPCLVDARGGRGANQDQG